MCKTGGDMCNTGGDNNDDIGDGVFEDVSEEVKSPEIDDDLDMTDTVTSDIMKRSTRFSKSLSTNTTNTITATVGTNTDTGTDRNKIQFLDYKLGAFQEIRDRCQQYSEMVEFTKPTRTKY